MPIASASMHIPIIIGLVLQNEDECGLIIVQVWDGPRGVGTAGLEQRFVKRTAVESFSEYYQSTENMYM